MAEAGNAPRSGRVSPSQLTDTVLDALQPDQSAVTEPLQFGCNTRLCIDTTPLAAIQVENNAETMCEARARREAEAQAQAQAEAQAQAQAAATAAKAHADQRASKSQTCTNQHLSFHMVESFQHRRVQPVRTRRSAPTTAAVAGDFSQSPYSDRLVAATLALPAETGDADRAVLLADTVYNCSCCKSIIDMIFDPGSQMTAHMDPQWCLTATVFSECFVPAVITEASGYEEHGPSVGPLFGSDGKRSQALLGVLYALVAEIDRSHFCVSSTVLYAVYLEVIYVFNTPAIATQKILPNRATETTEEVLIRCMHALHKLVAQPTDDATLQRHAQHDWDAAMRTHNPGWLVEAAETAQGANVGRDTDIEGLPAVLARLREGSPHAPLTTLADLREYGVLLRPELEVMACFSVIENQTAPPGCHEPLLALVGRSEHGNKAVAWGVVQTVRSLAARAIGAATRAGRKHTVASDWARSVHAVM